MPRTVMHHRPCTSRCPDCSCRTGHGTNTAMRIGFWRLRDCLLLTSMPTPTLAINGSVCQSYPPVAQAALDAGWGVHGPACHTQRPMHHLDDEQPRFARRSRRSREFTGKRPRGCWESPGLTETYDLHRPAGGGRTYRITSLTGSSTTNAMRDPRPSTAPSSRSPTRSRSTTSRPSRSRVTWHGRVPKAGRRPVRPPVSGERDDHAGDGDPACTRISSGVAHRIRDMSRRSHERPSAEAPASCSGPASRSLDWYSGLRTLEVRFAMDRGGRLG